MANIPNPGLNWFKAAGVSCVALVCVPLIALIFSAITHVDWSGVGTVCAFAGGFAVAFWGVGMVVKIIKSDEISP